MSQIIINLDGLTNNIQKKKNFHNKYKKRNNHGNNNNTVNNNNNNNANKYAMNNNANISVNNKFNKNLNYKFCKSNYNFEFIKYKNEYGIIYSIKYNQQIQDIKLPNHLCSKYNDNYICNLLMKIIKNTKSLPELIYQWTNAYNIITNTYSISNIQSFTDNMINFINNLKSS